MSLETRYRRMMRWYPPSWRRVNGEVLLGILLDEAESHGRTAPRLSERASAALHGSAARFDARLALVCSLAAITITALFALLGFLEITPLASPATSIAVSGIAPALVTLALLAALRIRGRVSDGGALAASGLSVAAVSLLTVLRFRLFGTSEDEPSATVIFSSHESTAWLSLAALVAGAGAVAIVLHASARRHVPWLLLRIPLVALSSLFAPLLAAAVTTMPGAVGPLALVPLGLVARSSRPLARASRTPRPRVADPLEALALTAGIYGTISIAMGIQRIPFGFEMAQDDMVPGLLYMLMGGVPLLIAQGLRATQNAWPAVALGIAALALAGAALATGAGTPWLMLASALCGGIAIALWLAPTTGWIFAGALLVLYSSGAGAMLTPALGLIVACASLIATIAGFRRDRRDPLDVSSIPRHLIKSPANHPASRDELSET